MIAGPKLKTSRAIGTLVCASPPKLALNAAATFALAFVVPALPVICTIPCPLESVSHAKLDAAALPSCKQMLLIVRELLVNADTS